MANSRGQRNAFGAPGDEPRWTDGKKDGVGTAYSASSRLWSTLLDDIVTETYCPTVDRAHVRDLQLVATDGASFVHEERRHMTTATTCLCAPHLEGGGWHNNARIMEVAGRGVLVAEKHGSWLAVSSTQPFRKLSCGYVGRSDGWADLGDNFRTTRLIPLDSVVAMS